MRTDAISAGFWPRAAALLIDRAILFLPLLPIRLAAWWGDGGLALPVFFAFTLSEVICALVSIGYFTLLTWRGGATVGKRFMNLRVEREDGEARGVDPGGGIHVEEDRGYEKYACEHRPEPGKAVLYPHEAGSDERHDGQENEQDHHRRARVGDAER